MQRCRCSTMNMTSSFQSGRTGAKFTPKKPLILIEDGFTPRTDGQGRITKSGRTTKEIAEIIRTYLKEVYSDCKWSVRYSSASMCTHISVALMEAPYQVFVDENKTHIDLNQYYMDREERLVPEAKAMMTDVVELINSYRYDDSDGMIDYFDTNFYYDVSVGKWDKPFKVVYREKKNQITASMRR